MVDETGLFRVEVVTPPSAGGDVSKSKPQFASVSADRRKGRKPLDRACCTSAAVPAGELVEAAIDTLPGTLAVPVGP